MFMTWISISSVWLQFNSVFQHLFMWNNCIFFYIHYYQVHNGQKINKTHHPDIKKQRKESRELGKLGKAKFQSQILVNFGEVKFLHRARRILKDSTHPSYSLFTLLPPGKRYRSMCRCTTRLQSSFFLQAVRLLNSSSTHFPE